MTEKSRQKIFIGVLILAMIYGAYNFWPSDQESGKPATTELSPAAVSKAPAEKSNAGLIDVEAMETLAWGDDPFQTERPAKKVVRLQSQKKPLWNLSGIVYNPSRPMAIINKKTVSVGDIIDKATVRSIENKAVILEYQGVRLTLTVNKG